MPTEKDEGWIPYLTMKLSEKDVEYQKIIEKGQEFRFRKQYQQVPPPTDNPCPLCGVQLQAVHHSRPDDFRCPANECNWRSRR